MRPAVPAAILGLAVLAAPRARGQDGETQLPLVFVHAKAGDWLAVSARIQDDGASPQAAPNFATMTIGCVDSGDVTLGIDWERLPPPHTVAHFKQAEAPSLDEYLSLFSQDPVHCEDVKLEIGKHAVAGQEIECVKATFTTKSPRGTLENTVWLSSAARAFGLVAWESKLVGKRPGWSRVVEMVGFGTGNLGFFTPEEAISKWGKTSAEAHAALCEDDTRLPVNPHADAKEGDWAAYAFDSNGDRSVHVTWSVVSVKYRTARIKVVWTDGHSWEFDRSLDEPPTIAEFLACGCRPDFAITDVKVEDAELELQGGKKIACKKVTATQTQVHEGNPRPYEGVAVLTLWLSMEVKGSGVAHRDGQGNRGTRVPVSQVLLGWGSKDDTDWGQSADDALEEEQAWHRKVTAMGEALKRGDVAAATKALQTALARARRTSETDAHVPQALEQLALMAVNRRDFAEAESLYKQAIEVREKTPGPGRGIVAGSISALGRLYDLERKYDEAEPLLSKALDLVLSEYGPTSTLVGYAHQNLGFHYLSSGKRDEAAKAYERALELFGSTEGDSCLDVVRIVPQVLGVYVLLGKFPEAEPLARRTVATYEQYAPASPDCAQAHANLAWVLESEGKHALAAASCEKALEIYDARKADAFVATELEVLAEARQHLHQTDKAQQFYERALAILEGAFGKEDFRIAKTLAHLASLEEERGHGDKAVSLYERSIAIQEKASGEKAPGLAYPLAKLGGLYASQGKLDEAEPLLSRALSIAEEAYGGASADTARCTAALAQLRGAQGKTEEAEKGYSRALPVLEKALGREHVELLPLLRDYASVLTKLEKRDEAAKLEDQIRKIEENEVR